MGKKQSEYQIKKQADANYFVLNFDAPGDSVKSFSDKLRLEQEDLLRYLLLRKKDAKISPDRRIGQKVEEQSAKPKVTVVTKKTAKVKKGTKSTGSTKSKKSKKK